MRSAIGGGTPVYAHGQEPVTITATPYTWREPATIKRREFLYGFELQRGHVSAVIAPGAAGKTTFKVARALTMVTGRDFMGKRVWNGPHRVWLWNLEDDLDEMARSIQACCKLWNISPDDIGDRLFVDSALDGSILKLAESVEGRGYTIKKPVVEALIAELKARRIDYLDIDPFVSSHSVEENDNGAIDAVTKEWVKVAKEGGCAVSLAHHVRKPSGGEATAFDARGAVAMINASRSVLVINRMSKDEAEIMGVQPCDMRRFIKIYDDKNNRAPPALKADWYEFQSVDLGNGDDTGPADSVGSVAPWKAPDAFGGVTARQLLNIQNEIEKLTADVSGSNTHDIDACRKHSMANKWVGKTVARVLDMNVNDKGDQARLKLFVSTWLSNGALKAVERKDGHGEVKEFVEVGAWVQETEL